MNWASFIYQKYVILCTIQKYSKIVFYKYVISTDFVVPGRFHHNDVELCIEHIMLWTIKIPKRKKNVMKFFCTTSNILQVFSLAHNYNHGYIYPDEKCKSKNKIYISQINCPMQKSDM